jgi:hypothetical protein
MIFQIMNKISKSKIAVLTVIIGMMMAASSVFANAHAAPTTVLNGRGTGTYTCADGTENTNLQFFIFVNKEKGKTSQFKLSGSWSIYPQGGFDSGIQGTIYGGKIGKTSYSLLSIDQFHSGFVCPNDALPSKGTVTGQCGQGVNVEFKSENGGHGTFTGNIVCY